MSSVIPKEKQTAYERWEMTSFNEDRRAKASATLSPEQVAALREEARAQGYAEGLLQGQADGAKVGHAEALQQGREKTAQEVKLLQQIAEQFGTEVAHANEVIAQDMLDLALDLTKAMLKTALQLRPELVLPVVAEAIRYLPSLQQPALLFLHADDAHLIREHMETELEKAGWRIVIDTHMQRGGCRVETGSNQIDATTETRWQRIAAALGKDTAWLDA